MSKQRKIGTVAKILIIREILQHTRSIGTANYCRHKKTLLTLLFSIRKEHKMRKLSFCEMTSVCGGIEEFQAHDLPDIDRAIIGAGLLGVICSMTIFKKSLGSAWFPVASGILGADLIYMMGRVAQERSARAAQIS